MLVIAKNTLKEFVRNKILYTILIVAVILILLSILMSTLAVRQEERIIINFSLSVIEFFWLITTLFMWSYLLYSEMARNTILVILSKSPSRINFILWKFIWFSFVIFLVYFLLTLTFLFVLYLHGIWFELSFIVAIFLSFVKIILVLWFIIFFSTFVSPFMALLASLSVYIIWHSTAFIKYYMLYSNKVELWAFWEWLTSSVYYIFPNFTSLSIKEHIFSPMISNFTSFQLIFSVIYALIYLAILLFLSIFIFNKKEF